MRKTFRKAAALLLTAGMAIGMAAVPAAAEESKGLDICIITSSGVDDGSFNQDCYNGILTFLEDHSDCKVTDIKEADLAQIRQELSESGYIKSHVTGKNSRKEKITSRPFHYLSSDGFDISVGKNNIQNDELTFKTANGGDWWFHAKKIPGSHVVLLTGGKEVPDRAFEEAAALAAYYSKGKVQEKVEIDYLKRKDVKKPNGAKPGFVVYYTNYSMAIAPDISSLKLISD